MASGDKKSIARIVYPPEYSGSNTLDKYIQGANVRNYEQQLGSTIAKLRPTSDDYEIIDGEIQFNRRVAFNDLKRESLLEGSINAGRQPRQQVASFTTPEPLVDEWLERAIVSGTYAQGIEGEFFGLMSSIHNRTVIIGARQDQENGTRAGAAYIFEETAGEWSPTRLTSSNPSSGDQFGIGVSIYDTTAVVGSTNEDTAGSNAGAAYVFEKLGGEWTETAILTASDAGSGDFFGRSVSIFEDTIAVGAISTDETISGAGSVYVFNRSGLGWAEVAILTASDAGSSDNSAFLGQSVSVFSSKVLAGAPQADLPGQANPGAAYIFEDVGTGWVETTKLTASNYDANDDFGWSVSLYDDTAIVGAPYSDPVLTDSGQAYIYRQTGSEWAELAILTASDATRDDLFGYSVSVSGSIAFVGSPLHPYGTPATIEYGSVYKFDEVGAEWIETKLTASDRTDGDRFGISVSTHAGYAVIGAYGAEGISTGVTFSGEAYILENPSLSTIISPISTPAGRDIPSGYSTAPSSELLDYDFGQIDAFQDGSSYDDIDRTDPLVIMSLSESDKVFPDSLVYHTKPQLVDSTIEPLTIRNTLDRHVVFDRDSKDTPWFVRGTRADLGLTDSFRRSVIVSDEEPTIQSRIGIGNTRNNLDSAHPYKDVVSYFGPVYHPETLYIPDNTILPFEDKDNVTTSSIMYGTISSKSSLQTLIGHQNGSFGNITRGGGMIYNLVDGVDSLAYGGLKK